LKLSHNYVAKKLSGYVSILEWATNNDLIEKNTFRGLFMTKKDDKVDWLETKDIECIASASFATNMLSHVRDFFLFCTYTGLSYQDYIELDDTKHLQEIKGRLWIIKQRAKGENQDYGDFEVPLFEPAKQLLEKYGSLKNLPKMANQTFNRLLKEMGNILGNGLDGTRLTCHLARHTFIWWALNVKKMSRESVSRMVGHSDTRMLNKYAPITRTRIEGELDDLGE
jgi:integrase